MKIEIDFTQRKDMKLLTEIHTLKSYLDEISHQRGPANPEYISLSLKLDTLIKKYIEYKLLDLMKTSKNEPKEVKNLSETLGKNEEKNKTLENPPIHQFFTYYTRQK